MTAAKVYVSNSFFLHQMEICRKVSGLRMIGCRPMDTEQGNTIAVNKGAHFNAQIVIMKQTQIKVSKYTQYQFTMAKSFNVQSVI